MMESNEAANRWRVQRYRMTLFGILSLFVLYLNWLFGELEKVSTMMMDIHDSRSQSDGLDDSNLSDGIASNEKGLFSCLSSLSFFHYCISTVNMKKMKFLSKNETRSPIAFVKLYICLLLYLMKKYCCCC